MKDLSEYYMIQSRECWWCDYDLYFSIRYLGLSFYPSGYRMYEAAL